MSEPPRPPDPSEQPERPEVPGSPPPVPGKPVVETSSATLPAGAGLPLADGLRMAVGTLTALPVPPPSRIDRRVAGTAMVLGPVAGLVPGIAAAVLVALAGAAGAASMLAATLAIGTNALTTRGLHLDGLADTADGLTAAYDRERALAIMRRGDTGPAGAGALVLVLLLQVTALAQAIDRLGAVAAAVALVIGRAALVLGCARGVPSARPGGLGATVSGTVPPLGVAGTLLAVAAAAAAALAPTGGLAGAVTGVAAVAAATGAAGALLLRVVRRLGGITGDVLGACVETATAAALVVLAVTPG